MKAITCLIVEMIILFLAGADFIANIQSPAIAIHHFSEDGRAAYGQSEISAKKCWVAVAGRGCRKIFVWGEAPRGPKEPPPKIEN